METLFMREKTPEKVLHVSEKYSTICGQVAALNFLPYFSLFRRYKATTQKQLTNTNVQLLVVQGVLVKYN